MHSFASLQIMAKAIGELGLQQLGWLSLYKIGLYTGYYRWRERRYLKQESRDLLRDPIRLFQPPEKPLFYKVLQLADQERVIEEAEQIIARRVCLFGGEDSELVLAPPLSRLHWTTYEMGEDEQNSVDIKFIWEPARMGWAILLARAYALSGDERFSKAFWDHLDEFIDKNPPYHGLNWISSQEAAIRLIVISFCWQVFGTSFHSTIDRTHRLTQMINDHAIRIRLTMAYARAQNNNHLLSEAAGLYTAGVMIPNYPSADEWRRIGWRIFHQGIRSQIDEDGVYIQQSVNYHRLVLQLALWMLLVSTTREDRFPEDSLSRLAASTRWLLALLDPDSGRMPNLGPNDGAYILPLTVQPFSDYRPILQAAGSAFLGKRLFEAGPWDEMELWLLGSISKHSSASTHSNIKEEPTLLRMSENPLILQHHEGGSWAYLRAAHFRARPGHADQLHLDLWWRGHNIAVDPGTYLYNAPPPWDNSLSGSDVHNTVTIDERDQMLRAGRFLFLDWAQSRLINVQKSPERHLNRVIVEHDGYRGINVVHRRIVDASHEDIWLVEDFLMPSTSQKAMDIHRGCLNWLLPDWEWEVCGEAEPFVLQVTSPDGQVVSRLSVSCSAQEISGDKYFQIVRAGVSVFGGGEVKPYWGWYSPTYGQKVPALAVRLSINGRIPMTFRSEWHLVGG